jgi:hypothetical protein
MVVFKTVVFRDKTQIVHMARQVYTETISTFLTTSLDVCEDPHNYLFLDLTTSINNSLIFRTNIFPGGTTEMFVHVGSNEPIEVTDTLPSLLKDPKPQARRALLASAVNDLINLLSSVQYRRLIGIIN